MRTMHNAKEEINMNEDMVEDMRENIILLLEDNAQWEQVYKEQNKRLKKLEKDLAKIQLLLSRTIAEKNAAVNDLYIGRACNTCAYQYTEKCLLEDHPSACSEFSEGDVPYKWRWIEKYTHNP